MGTSSPTKLSDSSVWKRHLVEVDTFQMPNQTNLLALVFDPLGATAAAVAWLCIAGHLHVTHAATSLCGGPSPVLFSLSCTFGCLRHPSRIPPGLGNTSVASLPPVLHAPLAARLWTGIADCDLRCFRFAFFVRFVAMRHLLTLPPPQTRTSLCHLHLQGKHHCHSPLASRFSRRGTRHPRTGTPQLTRSSLSSLDRVSASATTRRSK